MPWLGIKTHFGRYFSANDFNTFTLVIPVLWNSTSEGRLQPIRKPTLEEGGGQHHAPVAIPLKKIPYPLYKRQGGFRGRSGQPGNPTLTGIRSPDWPVRSKSLHRLSYSGSSYLIVSPKIYTTSLLHLQVWILQAAGQILTSWLGRSIPGVGKITFSL
jgi:hypothetical protein